MVSPPTQRVEVIFFSDHDTPLHVWLIANEDWAREIECDNSKTLKILLAAVLFVFFSVLLAPITIVLLLLLTVMILLPAYIVGMIGFFRGY